MMIPSTIRFGSRSTLVARWQRFVGVVADGDFGRQTETATKAVQAANDLKPDGIVGPKTWALESQKEPSMHQPILADELIIGGVAYKAPEGVEVLNWTNGGDSVPRLVSGGKRTRVTELVLHETCDNPGAEDTLATLKKRGLSVHLIVDAFGRVTQHADLLSDVTQHAGKFHNGPSIGIEVDNPYYPSWNRRPDVWPDVIPAPWAHAEPGKRGRYVVPTLASAETTCQLTAMLTSGAFPGIDIPRTWIGRRGTKFALGLVSGAEKPSPGIYAHHYFAHADAAWLALYCFLRLEVGCTPIEARTEAIRLTTGAVGAVTLPPGAP